MAFDITQFRTSLRTEVANPTNYEVIISKEPSVMTNVIGLGNDFPDIIKYRCESCSLPSKALKYVNQTTFGPPRKVAYSAEYQDVSFTFMVTDSMIEKEYFSLWQTSIINNDVTQQSANENLNNVTYYDNYVGTIQIKVFNKVGQETYRITFEEAYPIVVQETPMSWNSNNDYVRTNVMIAYRYFIEERYAEGISANVVLNKDPSVINRNVSSTVPISATVNTGTIPTRNNSKVDEQPIKVEIIPPRERMPHQTPTQQTKKRNNPWDKID